MFKPVRVARASADVVEQIKGEIFAGRLSAGDRLPSEKELAEQFNLSRVTVRDALRILESHGLIHIKVGAGGGAFVSDPSLELLTQSLSTLLRLNRINLSELVEARKIIEAATVELAAVRATPEDVRVLERALGGAQAALSAGDLHYMPHSVEFHVAIALAAHNQVLLFTVNSFRTMFYEVLETLLPTENMARRAARDHALILAAIKAHQPEKARRLMLAHLQYFEDQLRAKAGASAQTERRNGTLSSRPDAKSMAR